MPCISCMSYSLHASGCLFLLLEEYPCLLMHDFITYKIITYILENLEWWMPPLLIFFSNWGSNTEWVTVILFRASDLQYLYNTEVSQASTTSRWCLHCVSRQNLINKKKTSRSSADAEQPRVQRYYAIDSGNVRSCRGIRCRCQPKKISRQARNCNCDCEVWPYIISQGLEPFIYVTTMRSVGVNPNHIESWIHLTGST